MTAEEAWLAYRDEYMRARGDSSRRVTRQMRKREFIAGYGAALSAAGCLRDDREGETVTPPRRPYNPDHCTACGDFLPCGQSWLPVTPDGGDQR